MLYSCIPIGYPGGTKGGTEIHMLSEPRSRYDRKARRRICTANPSEEVHSRTCWGSLLLRLDAARTHRTVLERILYSTVHTLHTHRLEMITALAQPHCQNLTSPRLSIILLHQSHYSDLPKRTSPPSDIPCPHKSQQSASQPTYQASNRQTLLHPPTHPQPINHNPI